ncbi:hypothetical protein D3C87_1985080 [compost metagenome]
MRLPHAAVDGVFEAIACRATARAPDFTCIEEQAAASGVLPIGRAALSRIVFVGMKLVALRAAPHDDFFWRSALPLLLGLRI